MVCETLRGLSAAGLERVLILVLMEDGLRDNNKIFGMKNEKAVLILVLMEDGLRVMTTLTLLQSHLKVLILVLMEDGLRVWKKK